MRRAIVGGSTLVVGVSAAFWGMLLTRWGDFGCTVLAAADEVHATSYGVDISYPMHHENISTNYAYLPHNIDPSIPTPADYIGMPINPLGPQAKERYDEYIRGCVDYYNNDPKHQHHKKGNRCIHGEAERIEMTLKQPKSVYNYTEMGFTKIRAPENVYKIIKEFWDKNRGKETLENWIPGNVYTNHWKAPTYMLGVENVRLEGAGYVLKQHIWNAARDTIEAWTGHRLAECSLYGIRIYKEGAMLAPHVDRLPLVSSAIINVDQDVDELWPLEVIGHDGVAHNVTMLPGDMVLYESHSVIHGRQFPLKGRFMANVFIHFEPIGPIGGRVAGNGDLPPYLIPGSESEPDWRAENPKGHRLTGPSGGFATGSTELHHYSLAGDYDKVKRTLDQHEDLVNVRDENGWSALHEAVRSGATEVVKLLIERGAEVNGRTGPRGYGESPLAMAKKFLGLNHDITKHLQELGAMELRYNSKNGSEL